MEFLDREKMHRRPGGVEIRLNKKFNHEDMVKALSQPWRLWDREEIVLDHEGKNRIGHGRLKMGLSCRPPKLWISVSVSRSQT